MTIIGDAYVAIRPESSGFATSTKEQIGGALKGIALGAGGLFAVAGVEEFFRASVDRAQAAQKEALLVGAAIKSTGGVAHISAGQVDSLAASLSAKTAIDRTQIETNEALLLRFTNIRNEAGKGRDIFNQATKASLDLSVAFGKDGAAAAVQLGKALNDPTKGLALLRRVGIQFTDQQKQQIETLQKSGHTLEAQQIILTEVNKKFGGSAAATATPLQKLKVAFADLELKVGNAVLPVLSKLAAFLADKLPGVLAAVSRLFGRLSDALAPIIAKVKAFIDANGGLSATFEKFKPALIAIGVLIAALVSPIAVAVAAIVLLYTKSAVARDIIDTVFRTIATIVGQVVEFVDNIIRGHWADAFGNLVKIVETQVTAVIHILGTLVGLIEKEGLKLVGKMVELAGNLIGGLVSGIASGAGKVLTALKNFVLDKIPGFVKKFFGIGSPSKMFAGFGANLVEGLAQGIRDNAHLPAQALGGLSKKLAVNPLGLGVAAVGAGAGSGRPIIQHITEAANPRTTAQLVGIETGRAIRTQAR